MKEKNYRLARPVSGDAAATADLTARWRAFGGRMNPGLLRQYDGDFAAWLRLLDRRERGEGIGEEVHQTFYFFKDGDGGILGAAALRHYLNHTNLLDGGHVGCGIRPEFRGRGLSRVLLGLCLEKLRKMGVEQVLITCDADNLPSRRMIERQGGILENETADEDGVPIRRYWIAQEV